MKVCIRKNRLLVFGESEYFIILCFIYSTAIDFLIYFSNSLSYTSTLHGVVRLQKTVVTQNHFNTKPSYARRPKYMRVATRVTLHFQRSKRGGGGGDKGCILIQSAESHTPWNNGLHIRWYQLKPLLCTPQPSPLLIRMWPKESERWGGVALVINSHPEWREKKAHELCFKAWNLRKWLSVQTAKWRGSGVSDAKNTR